MKDAATVEAGQMIPMTQAMYTQCPVYFLFRLQYKCLKSRTRMNMYIGCYVKRNCGTDVMLNILIILIT